MVLLYVDCSYQHPTTDHKLGYPVIFTKKQKQAISTSETIDTDIPASHDAADARIICDAQGYILHANDAFTTMVAADTIQKGQSFSEYIQFHEQDLNARNIREIYSGDYAVAIRQSQQSAILHMNWAENSDGREMLIASFTLDQSLQVNDALGVSNTPVKTDAYHDSDTHDLSGFLDMSHEVLCTLSLDGNFGWLNDTFCSLLKTDNSVINGRGFIDMVHPRDRTMVWQYIHDLFDLHDGTLSDFECAMVASDGEILHIKWRFKKTENALYCVGQDLTAIKNHEYTLHKQEKKLLEAEAIGRMGHWHWKLGEDHFTWSDEIYRIFGTEKDSFIPSIDTVNSMVHRGDSGRIMQVFQRAMIENKDYEMDLRIERPDGSICYVRCQGRCESDADGDVLGLYGIMQDITQDTMREQDLRDAKDAAESAYAAKSRFLANMSHELRTPLNAIIGFSEMIQNQLLGPIGNERYIEYIGGIRESGEHLLDLISDILDMSKIEAGKYELTLEKFTVSKVIRMAIHMIEGRALDSSLKLTCEIEDEDLQIIADRRAIMQVMLNLLSNAVKFSSEGGSIKTVCKRDGNFIALSVSDEGIGIPAHKLQTIMRPFEQVSSHYTREHEGSGLGLAITKELIEMHNGKIDISSQMDQGTTVTLKIPLESN